MQIKNLIKQNLENNKLHWSLFLQCDVGIDIKTKSKVFIMAYT